MGSQLNVLLTAAVRRYGRFTQEKGAGLNAAEDGEICALYWEMNADSSSQSDRYDD
jgi:hypothetical protein